MCHEKMRLAIGTLLMKSTKATHIFPGSLQVRIWLIFADLVIDFGYYTVLEILNCRKCQIYSSRFNYIKIGVILLDQVLYSTLKKLYGLSIIFDFSWNRSYSSF